MAKETKQDRIVRQIMDQMTEHVVELKALDANPNCKEADVEKWAQTFVKSCLGYSVSNGYSVKAQDQKGKLRPDLVVYKGDKPVFVVEVKKLGFDFEKSDFRSGKIQLKEYLSTIGDVPYGFLCNGFEWKLYDFTNKERPIEIQKLNFKEDGVLPSTNKKDIEDICYDFITLHETSFSSGEWADLSKEATAFSPDSLTKAVLTSNVMKVITKEIRGEHEFKACSDLLYEKVLHLLCYGLDNALKESFNQEKKAELEKYMKGQMRQLRKAKKVQKKEESAQTVSEPAVEAIIEQPKTEVA